MGLGAGSLRELKGWAQGFRGHWGTRRLISSCFPFELLNLVMFPPSAFHPLFCRVLGVWVGAGQAERDTPDLIPWVKLGLTVPPPSRGGGLPFSLFCDNRGVNLPTERMVPFQVWLNLTPKVTPILKWLKRKKNLRHTVFWFLTLVTTCLSLQSNLNGKDRLEMDVYSSAGNRGNLEGLLLK